MEKNQGEITVRRLTGDIPLVELVCNTESLFTPEVLETLAKNSNDVCEWLGQKGFDIVVITGRSGIISEKILEDTDRIKVCWTDREGKKEYQNRDMYLKQIHEIHSLPSDTSIAVVDDYMGSGIIKARQTLKTLASLGVKNYGFGSFIGPRVYNKDVDISAEECILKITENDKELTKHLFFPPLKDAHAHKYMAELEKIATYYYTSNDAKLIIDKATKEIKERATDLRKIAQIN